MNKTKLENLITQLTELNDKDPEITSAGYVDAGFLRNIWEGLPLSIYIKTVEQAPVAISITDKKANILYVNEAFAKVTGYESEEILGENESKLSDKCTPKQVYYDLWHTITRKQVWNGQVVNRRKQGDRYLAELTIAPMLDENGKISHYIGMHRDISRQYLAEQRVNNQKLLIESVINTTPVALVVLDRNNQIILDNDMYKMLISDLDHVQPIKFFLETLTRDLGDLWNSPEIVQKGFTNHEVRFEGNSLRQTRWFTCSGNWFTEHDPGADNFFSRETRDYLLLSISDISPLKRQQEKLHLQTLQHLLTEEEHIRSIRETLLGAIHHIRQPINQIKAALQIMMQRNDSNNQPLQDLLHQVLNMGEDTVSTLQKCVPEISETVESSVNLNQLIHEVMRLYKTRFLANGVVVDWQPNPLLHNILGAEKKLHMLFKQLLDNAINAFNRAGSPERCITIGTRMNLDWVEVSICDSGPGIPLNLHNKVFEPFFSTETRTGIQSGMGLVMVKEIVNQHKGIIVIEPDYTHGCCFTIKFPAYNSKSDKVSGNE